MRPLEYKAVGRSEDSTDMDGFENDEPSQQPTRGLRPRVPSARKSLVLAWVLFGTGVIIGGITLGQSRPQRHDDSPGGPSLASGAGDVNGSTDDNPPGRPSVPSNAGDTPSSINDSVDKIENDENDEATASNVPTPMPLALQDIPATDPPTTGESCDTQFDCISDRLGQNEKMTAGQAICSRDHRYAFGMQQSSSNGITSLIWKDCATGDTKRYMYYKMGEAEDYFAMDETAKFAVYGANGQAKWEKHCLVSVKKYAKCLGKPEYDCPYLHLHRGGVVVLNYIDGWDWISKNINKKTLYDF